MERLSDPDGGLVAPGTMTNLRSKGRKSRPDENEVDMVEMNLRPS